MVKLKLKICQIMHYRLQYELQGEQMKRPALTYGIACTPIGLIIGCFIAITANGDGYGDFILAAPLSIFLTGMLFWRFLMIKPLYWLALLVGFFNGIFSHWLCWYGILVFGYFFTDLPNKASLREYIDFAVTYSRVSLLFFGWLTVGWSILVAFVLTKLLRRQKAQKKATRR
jgi:hypothetical protein